MLSLAPAKINLFLELLGRREDGFHELETLIVPISLFDSLRFEILTDARVRLGGRFEFPLRYRDGAQAAAPDDFWGEANLVHRAAEIFLRRNGDWKRCLHRCDQKNPFSSGVGRSLLRCGNHPVDIGPDVQDFTGSIKIS